MRARRCLVKPLGSVQGACARRSLKPPERAAERVGVRAATVTVYMEWAPLPQLATSGLLRACAYLLEVPDFRMDACEALRMLSLRRQAQVNPALAAPSTGGRVVLSSRARSGCPGSCWLELIMFACLVASKAALVF